MKNSIVLRSPDPADPTGNPSDPGPKPLEGATDPSGAAKPQAPPPAAQTVITGTKSEREIQLEKRVSELEDQNRTLSTPPPKKKDPAPEKKSFMDGLLDF